MLSQQLAEARTQALRILLRPVVRYCLKSAHSLQEIIENLKVVLVELSKEQMLSTEKKINVSRLSAMTGVHRRDVRSIIKKKQIPASTPSVIARVVGQWESDPAFGTTNGKPRILSFEGPESEFYSLCFTVSTDLHPGTVLYELERLQVVEKVARGLKLKQLAPRFHVDPKRGLNLLGRDGEALVTAVLENLDNQGEDRNLHLRCEYDNIELSQLSKLRAWIRREGIKFQARVRRQISTFDLDINPSRPGPGGGRMLVCSFSLTATSRSDSESPK